FSEPMVFYTEDPGEVRGNIDTGADDEDPVDSDNYFITVTRAGVEVLAEFPWSDAGFATFDTDDRTHKTVLLRLDNEDNDLWEPGDKINVRVSSSVVDPAGNSVDSGNDEDDDTAS
ncbi:MAG TPA: hypothetical protein VK968_14045, partial [Roseimicrobium sp.]|nr:hypothetical protein [Roseimicrobium sp.]